MDYDNLNSEEINESIKHLEKKLCIIENFQKNENIANVEEVVDVNHKEIVEAKNRYKLTDNEIIIIFNGMDKIDYKKHCRFLDLEDLSVRVSNNKKKVKNLILVNISLLSQNDTLPPQSSYLLKYTFDYSSFFYL